MEKASILAVGTELVTGQVVNTNSAFLSEKLSDLGFEVVLHETVPDDRAAIREALDRCAIHGKVVLVTGGLGPTSDDFTREVIAEWIGKPLQFHEPSWKRIEERLSAAGLAVPESNKQQCYFPMGAEVLGNAEGTANGFSVTREDRRIFVFPGPPREVKAVWLDHVEPELHRWLATARPGVVPPRLRRWQCIGKPEAALGELVDAALKGSGLRAGFRVHNPYIEVKLWMPDASDVPPFQVERQEAALAKLEQSIAAWVVARDTDDLGPDFAKQIERNLPAKKTIQILDAATGGLIAGRMNQILRSEARERSLRVTTEWIVPNLSRTQLQENAEKWLLERGQAADLTFLVLGTTVDGLWAAGYRLGFRKKVEVFQSPYRLALNHERNRYLVSELVLKTWGEWLE